MINKHNLYLIALVSIVLVLMQIIIVGAAPFAYIPTNDFGGTVSVIDTATNKVTTTVPVGISPYGVAVTPDGTKVYVANYFDPNPTVSIINTSTNIVTATVGVGEYPEGVAVSPDGKKAYISNNCVQTITVFDTATDNDTGSTIGVDEGYADGVAVSPDGAKLYVTDQGRNDVHVIDTAGKADTATVHVGHGPFGVAVQMEQGFMWQILVTTVYTAILSL